MEEVQSVAAGVNTRPKSTPPSLVKPPFSKASLPTCRSPPGVTSKLQWVRPQASPVTSPISADVQKRTVIASASDAQKRTAAKVVSATTHKPSIPLVSTPSLPSKPATSSQCLPGASSKELAHPGRNSIAPPRALVVRPPSGFPGQSYVLSRPGSNKWQRSPGVAPPMRSPGAVPPRKNLQWVRKEAPPDAGAAAKPFGSSPKAGTSLEPVLVSKPPGGAAKGFRKPGFGGVGKVGLNATGAEARRDQEGALHKVAVLPGAACVDKKIILVEAKKAEGAKEAAVGATAKGQAL